MRILHIEDRSDAAKYANVLKIENHEVYHAKDLLDADRLLQSDINFDAAIIDLDLDKRLLPPQLQQYASAQHAGWIYYQHVLKCIPPLDKNTIILSGYIASLKTTITVDESEHVKFVDKKATDAISKVIEALNTMDANPANTMGTEGD